MEKYSLLLATKLSGGHIKLQGRSNGNDWRERNGRIDLGLTDMKQDPSIDNERSKSQSGFCNVETAFVFSIKITAERFHAKLKEQPSNSIYRISRAAKQKGTGYSSLVANNSNFPSYPLLIISPFSRNIFFTSYLIILAMVNWTRILTSARGNARISYFSPTKISRVFSLSFLFKSFSR